MDPPGTDPSATGPFATDSPAAGLPATKTPDCEVSGTTHGVKVNSLRSLYPDSVGTLISGLLSGTHTSLLSISTPTSLMLINSVICDPSLAAQ